MVRRVVLLPNGRHCGIGVYVASWKSLLKAPAGSSIRGFGHFPESREAILRELRAGIHERINKHLSWFGKGRKWSYEWQIETMRLAHQVNHPRLIISWMPAEWKPRFGHRLREAMEF